jgi:hypothetical protein
LRTSSKWLAKGLMAILENPAQVSLDPEIARFVLDLAAILT